MPPSLPAAINHVLLQRGYSEPVFLAQKQLCLLDVRPENGRFLIPQREIQQQFLTEEEKTTLNNGGMIPITLMNSEFSENNLTLRKLAVHDMFVGGVTSSYLLIRNGWNQVVLQNGLQPSNIVRLWSCRTPGNDVFFVFDVERVQRDVSCLCARINHVLI
ncbi:uncharacterized protein LOC132167203 [Corylus avellana]|uniref:uncharacterized protein LOC132167203 n=1 Tax=Corylus avellana TaxID=13451 RepID=UPI00286B620F|nr:uncharacterized protein LOC132167203 [Corylus avellana]